MTHPDAFLETVQWFSFEVRHCFISQKFGLFFIRYVPMSPGTQIILSFIYHSQFNTSQYNIHSQACAKKEITPF